MYDNGMSAQYNNAVQSLAISIVSFVPVILWGPPGTGKTSVLNSIAKAYNMHLETVMTNIREPSDFAGLPVIIDNEVVWAPPAWVKNLIRFYEETKKPSITFYDEISTARPAVQAAMLRPVLDGVVGDTALPPNNITVAAANPPDQAADGWDLSPPNANRFTHLKWELSALDIQRGFTKGWPEITLPKIDQSKKGRIKHAKTLVGSFVGAHPVYASQTLQEQEGEFDPSDLGFPTARSWEMVAKLYGTAKSARFFLPDGKSHAVSRGSIENLITGTVGKNAGEEFISFIDALDLPDPQEVLSQPETFPFPKRQDILYVLLNSVENAALNQGEEITANTWERWGDVLVRVLSEGYADVAYVFAKEWMSYRPENTRLNSKHSQAFGELFRKLEV